MQCHVALPEQGERAGQDPPLQDVSFIRCALLLVRNDNINR